MADLTVAASAKSVRQLFDTARSQFTFESQSASDVPIGPLRLGYGVKLHLENGTLELRDDGAFAVRELDIKWDVLRASVGFDIPAFCVGGFCVIPNPFGGCLVRVPRICLFERDPDISLSLDLSQLITSELSLRARPVTRYWTNPARTAAMSWLDAQEVQVANEWRLYLDDVDVDIDVFDVAEIVADLIEGAITEAVDAVLAPLPQWARDVFRSMLGGVAHLMREVLDIGDDIGEWLSDRLGVQLGLFGLLQDALANFFADRVPLARVEDPFQILQAQPPAVPAAALIPVKVPLTELTSTVTADELTLTATIGEQPI